MTFVFGGFLGLSISVFLTWRTKDASNFFLTGIVTNGIYVSVWEMLNYSFPLNGVLSNRSHKEYDCKAAQFRNLQGEFFNAPYIKGEKISSNMDPEDNWRPVVEGTQNQHLMQLVCGMRS